MPPLLRSTLSPVNKLKLLSIGLSDRNFNAEGDKPSAFFYVLRRIQAHTIRLARAQHRCQVGRRFVARNLLLQRCRLRYSHLPTG